MNESILSQEEIDALLKDSDEPTGMKVFFLILMKWKKML